MPSVLDLAELSSAAYDLRDLVSVARQLASHSAPGPSLVFTFASRPAAAAQAVALTRGLLGATGTGAAASLPVYGFAPAPAPLAPRRWTLERAWPAGGGVRGGFAAGLYVANDNRERVLAYRGTNPSDLDDLANDAQIAAGGVPSQAFPALQAAREAGLGDKDYLTGHSLGGALAVLVSADTRCPAATFNAPAVYDNCVRFESRSTVLPGFFSLLNAADRCSVTSRVRNYRVGGDPVSSWVTMMAAGFILKAPRTGLQPGKTAPDLAASGCFMLDAMCRHSMETVLTAIRADPANYAPIR